ncbi:MAG: hypothetical protein QMD12_03480 [Candidatus Aenigmarchaeota archaeon]|nr:hypothetical protein [Candidatus Aenigmarchaeota archaeon]
MKIEDLTGKKVRIIVSLGDVTAPYEGILRSANKWITIETKKGKKLFNSDAVILIEEIGK